MSEVNAVELRKLRKLRNKATPGPWKSLEIDATITVVTADSNHLAWTAVADCQQPELAYREWVKAGMVENPPDGVDGQDDAALIVAAVNALPILLDRIEELDGTVDRALREVDEHIAALVEAQARIAQLEAIKKAAREEARTRTEMLGEVPIGAIGQRHSQLMTAWINAGAVLDDALADRRS